MQNDHSTRVYDSMMGLLSDEQNPTPIVRLNHVVPFQHTKVYAKLEWYNPFGSVKDRVARNLVQDAEERGVLGPGKKLVEATSGNTGIGLIMIGNVLGYPLQTPLSKDIPLEKRTVLRFFGTQVDELDDSLCPMPGAPEGAIAKARETAESNAEFENLDQYSNEANAGAHYRTTGPEIWRQTGGTVTHFVAGLGTCGTITGTGRYLKEQNSTIKVLGARPEEGHDIPGVRSARQLQQTALYHPEEYDGEVDVSNREAYEMCLRLNREEIIIAGPRSAMNLIGALKLVPDEPDTVVVVIFPDNIYKYASSVVRHFPELAPPQSAATAGSDAPSKNDRFLAELIENLKNPHDTVRVNSLAEQLESDVRPTVIDIRIPDHFAESHIPGSVNIPQDDLSSRSAELPDDRDAPIVTVCNIGKFSKHATLYLKSKGYRNVRSAKGGLSEWVRKGYATSSGADA
ncbi:MAG: pyridoxal-phosphate dependent enzyme [Planctomycetota bacterium]|nr:pyridoxal-phosphate dependent enzyme [Planctomycetota bacterium]